MNRNGKILFAGLAGLALSLPGAVLAADLEVNPKGWYASLGGGLSKVSNTKFDLNAPLVTPVALTHSVTSKDGFGIVGAAGFKFDNNWRVEFELAYRKNDLGTVTPYAAPSGFNRAFSQFANILYDIDLGPDVVAYVGAGLGGVDAGYDIRVNNLPYLNNNDYAFGYQGVVGLSYRVAPQTYVFVDYHYMDAGKLDIKSAQYASVPRPEYKSHLVTAGLRFFFNAPPAPPAPAPKPAAAPAPAPAPKPAPAVPTPKNFQVFFDFDKSDITPQAQKIIESAADWAKKTKAVRISVTGHTDTMGTAKYNEALSLRRAEAVKAELKRLGYAEGEIVVSGKGFTQLLVPTGPQVKEPQNRRAEIVLQ